MSQERQVTVRVQKVKRNRIRMKLFLFAALAATLLLITIFAKDICPYDPYAQDLSQAMQPPSATHPMGTDTYGQNRKNSGITSVADHGGRCHGRLWFRKDRWICRQYKYTDCNRCRYHW